MVSIQGESDGKTGGNISVQNTETQELQSLGDRRESLDARKVKDIKARNQSLEIKIDNTNYELVKINTKLNAKPSVIEGEPPRKSKSKKRVTFDEMAPTASDYFVEKESELISLIINPLSVDTGDELSFSDLLPNFSFEADGGSVPAVAKSVSPAAVDLPMFQNNTIIKKKKKIQSPELELTPELESAPALESMNVETFSELDYYLEQQDAALIDKLSCSESDDTIISGDLELLETLHVNFLGDISNQAELISDQAEESKNQLLESKVDVSVQCSQGSDFSDKSSTLISMEKYNESISRFTQLESSFRDIQEENMKTNAKYEELLSKFSRLEAINGKLEQENKLTERKLLDSVCENSSLNLKHENTLHDTKQHMKGILNEVKILQMHVKAYKRQISVFDQEIS